MERRTGKDSEIEGARADQGNQRKRGRLSFKIRAGIAQNENHVMFLDTSHIVFCAMLLYINTESVGFTICVEMVHLPT